MDTKNIIAAISLSAAVIILYSLFFAPSPQDRKQIQPEKNITSESTDAPSLEQNEPVSKISRTDAINEGNRILFENDSIKGSISLTGSSIDDLTFKKYTKTLNGKDNIVLLNPKKVQNGYFVETGWVTANKNIEIPNSPGHGEKLEIRIRYSQVRLTGHDFLDVGTGNFTSTNYPGIPATPSDQTDETVESGGGRVFMTSTDQDGNFRVGDLFTVEQATGIATLNADAFSISGLQELQLGSVALGSTGAVINEFSTDGTFTANSDSIVPTQRAIKTLLFVLEQYCHYLQ